MKTNEIENCVEKCAECAKACLETLNHCLKLGGTHAEQHPIGLLMDCAVLCEASAKLMINRSEFHSQLCAVCAEVCEQCAEDCASFKDDAKMQSCAKMCEACAESCWQMSAVRRPA